MSAMNIKTQPSPAADPAGNGPDPDRRESAAQSPGDTAAMRALERAQIDEMSTIALDALRVLRLEILDPDHAPTDIPGTRVCTSDPTLAYVRLTRSVRLNLAARARMAVDDAEKGDAETPAAAALRCQREQQTVIEMSAIGMDLLRVLQQEVLDHFRAPTQGQGLWVHAGDPARAIELLTRAIRLNHAIRAKIADGVLGQRRRGKSAAPSRPARQQSAASASGSAAPDAGDDRDRAELSANAGEDAESEDVETGWDAPESEDLWSELDEDLDRELDEFGFLGDMLPNAVSSFVRREFERYVGIYTPRDRRAAPSDAFDPDPFDPDDPAEDEDPPDSAVIDLAVPLRAVLDAIPAQDGPAGELRRLTETLEAAARLLRPPGHDPP
jgi:hypothetical protein